MLRKIAVLAVLVVVIAAAFASAANLKVSGGAIQAGVDQSVYCDVDGVYVDGWGLETDVNQVTYVRIGGIDGACNGNEMFIKVVDGSQHVIASGKVVIASTTHTFNFPAVMPENIEGIKIWIEGAN